jgi:hypothetical protein
MNIAMNDVLLMTTCVLLACVCRSAGRSWSGPFVFFYGFWAAIFLLRIVLPIGLRPTSGLAAAIVGIGLVGLVLGLLVTSPWADLRRPRLLEADPAHGGAALPPIPTATSNIRRLLLASAGLLLAALYGLQSYRSDVSARAGVPIGDLTRQQVLYFQQHITGPSSKAELLLALCPVLAALGILLGRRHPVGYLLIVGALAISMQSPSRTETLSAAGITLVMYLYVGTRRKTPVQRSGPRAVRIAVLLALAAALAIIYFNIEGAAVKKASDPQPGVPAALSSLTDPVMYATGSISALSIATASPNGVPPETARLRSIWLGPRILSAIDPGVHVPETVAGYVDIPSPYNTYTMFGDLYFDFGLGGVFVASLLSGILFGWMHRRVVDDPSPMNAWTSSVGIVILFLGVTGFHLFWLGTATWLIAGGAIMWWIRAGRGFAPCRGEDVAGTDTADRPKSLRRRDGSAHGPARTDGRLG